MIIYFVFLNLQISLKINFFQTPASRPIKKKPSKIEINDQSTEEQLKKMFSDLNNYQSIEICFESLTENLIKEYAKTNSHPQFEVISVERVPNTNRLFFLFKFKSVTSFALIYLLLIILYFFH
jgi:hypothetical protein